MRASLEKQDLDMIVELIDERFDVKIKSIHLDRSPNDDRFLTIDEAVYFLGIKKNWLYNNHEKEGIPCYKIGGLKFKKSDLQKWAKSKIKV